jgi:hypothetical protein
MTSPSPAADHVSTAETAHQFAWARPLTTAGTGADPTERAAYLAAKTALLARITDQHHSPPSTKDTL